MTTLQVSSSGQIVLPAVLRLRLGVVAGAGLEVLEEAVGLKLRAVRPVAKQADVAALAGMVKAPARGVPRRLQDFDAAARCWHPRAATSREGAGHPRPGPLLHRRCR